MDLRSGVIHLRGGRAVNDGMKDQASSDDSQKDHTKLITCGDHKKASRKDCFFVCTWLCKQEEKQRTKRPSACDRDRVRVVGAETVIGIKITGVNVGYNLDGPSMDRYLGCSIWYVNKRCGFTSSLVDRVLWKSVVMERGFSSVD